MMQIADLLSEVDATMPTGLVRGGRIEGKAFIDLQRNSAPGRSWLLPAKNLYKETGRTNCELWTIDQGRFQSICLQTIQVEDRRDGPGRKRFKTLCSSIQGLALNHPPLHALTQKLLRRSLHPAAAALRRMKRRKLIKHTSIFAAFPLVTLSGLATHFRKLKI
jgi:hypothetical protein